MNDILDSVDDISNELSKVSALLFVIYDHQELVTKEDIKNATPTAYNMAYYWSKDNTILSIAWDKVDEAIDRLNKLHHKLYAITK